MVLLVLLPTLNVQGVTILLDPGHGGDDHGAKGFHRPDGGKKGQVILEKDLNLQICQRLYQLLQGKYSVYLTRSVDRNVSLMDRAAMAEKIQADLIISVHINSSSNRLAHGYEVYYLDNHHDVAVKKLEAVENFVANPEEQVVHQILTDLVIAKTVDSSKDLANFIHQELSGRQVKNKYHLKDRGTKAGLFFVLVLAKRPGVLLEVGFISNPQELAKMVNKNFQADFARGVARGIDRYFKKNKKPAESYLTNSSTML